jgi:Cu/Ag efflux pump CusA
MSLGAIDFGLIVDGAVVMVRTLYAGRLTLTIRVSKDTSVHAWKLVSRSFCSYYCYCLLPIFSLGVEAKCSSPCL